MYAKHKQLKDNSNV